MRPQVSKTVKGPRRSPWAEEWVSTGPCRGFWGSELHLPRQDTGPTPVANKNLLARTPLGRAGLSQGAGLLGSRPTGRERKGLLEDAAPRTQSPTRPGRQNRRAGLCHPTRNKRQLEPGSAAPVPAGLWGGGGEGEPGPWGREETRGSPERDGRHPGRGIPPPTPGGKGRLARGGEQSAPGRRRGVVLGLKVDGGAWRGSRISGGRRGSPRLRGYERKSSPRGNGGGSLQRNEGSRRGGGRARPRGAGKKGSRLRWRPGWDCGGACSGGRLVGQRSGGVRPGRGRVRALGPLRPPSPVAPAHLRSSGPTRMRGCGRH